MWGPGQAQAQARNPRSADYLFAATARDVRALWVNPAGLVAVVEASLMGELTFDRPDDGDTRLAQYTVGFNSRGLAVGYQRDRYANDSVSRSTLRLGLAHGVPGIALGATLNLHRGGVNQTGVDIGGRYEPAPNTAVALLLKNIGRPFVRDSAVRLRGVGSGAAMLFDGILELAAEARATERATSGFDMSYGAGAAITSGGPLPVGALVAFDLGSNFRIDRWSVGISIGAEYRSTVLGTVLPTPDRARIETVSVTGVAARRLGGR